MMKLKKAQVGSVASIATMMCADNMLEALNDNIIDGLPDSFENTKAKLKELIDTFNTDMEAASELYIEQEDEQEQQ